MSVKLQEPITGGGLQNTNFFNGRLVTGADLTREQEARREAVSRLGQAVGEGIVEGLKVNVVSNAENNPIVGITAGRAVNRCGQVLGLYEDTTVSIPQWRWILLCRYAGLERQAGSVTGD